MWMRVCCISRFYALFTRFFRWLSLSLVNLSSCWRIVWRKRRWVWVQLCALLAVETKCHRKHLHKKNVDHSHTNECIVYVCVRETEGEKASNECLFSSCSSSIHFGSVVHFFRSPCSFIRCVSRWFFSWSGWYSVNVLYIFGAMYLWTLLLHVYCMIVWRT